VRRLPCGVPPVRTNSVELALSAAKEDVGGDSSAACHLL
jgi:hypothetical protein